MDPLLPAHREESTAIAELARSPAWRPLPSRNYDPGLNRFLTRDMYAGAMADMGLRRIRS